MMDFNEEEKLRNEDTGFLENELLSLEFLYETATNDIKDRLETRILFIKKILSEREDTEDLRFING